MKVFFFDQGITWIQWNFMKHRCPFCMHILQVLTEEDEQQMLILGKPSWNNASFQNHLYSPSHLIHTLTNVKHASHDVYVSYSFGYLISAKITYLCHIKIFAVKIAPSHRCLFKMSLLHKAKIYYHVSNYIPVPQIHTFQGLLPAVKTIIIKTITLASKAAHSLFTYLLIQPKICSLSPSRNQFLSLSTTASFCNQKSHRFYYRISWIPSNCS